MVVEMKDLARMLLDLKVKDKDYRIRNWLVFEAAAAALKLGLQAGIRIDPREPEWPVVFIELPTGQVTWHMASHPVEWDGHTTEEKFKRINAFFEQVR